MKLRQMRYHLTRGTGLAHTTMDVPGRGGEKPLVSPSDREIRCMRRACLHDAFRNPLLSCTRPGRQSILIIQPANVMPSGA